MKSLLLYFGMALTTFMQVTQLKPVVLLDISFKTHAVMHHFKKSIFPKKNKITLLTMGSKNLLNYVHLLMNVNFNSRTTKMLSLL